MNRPKKQGSTRERLRRLKAVVVIVTLAVAGWYAPSLLAGRQRPVMSPAIRAVIADAPASFYSGKTTEPLPAGTPTGRLIAQIDLRGKALQGWQVLGDARVEESNDELHLSVEHGTVASVPFQLRRGHYEILIDARTQGGGLQVGLASAASDFCATNAFLSPNERTRPVPLAFGIPKTGRYYLVFRGWPGTDRSAAVIRKVSVYDTAVVLREQALARDYSSKASALVSMATVPTANLLYQWTFMRGIPQDWYLTRGSHVNVRPSGLLVRTVSAAYGYVFTTKLGLVQGPYLLRFNGAIVGGGLSIGAVNTMTDKWLALRYYWYGQQHSRGVMATRFVLSHTTNVELVVSNWALKPSASRWIIRNIELDELF